MTIPLYAAVAGLAAVFGRACVIELRARLAKRQARQRAKARGGYVL